MEGILEAYHQSLKTVQLYGPTNFSPVVNHVARYERNYPSLRRGARSLYGSQSAEHLQRGDAPVRDIKAAGDNVSVSGAELMKRKKLIGCFCEVKSGTYSTAYLVRLERNKQALSWMQQVLCPQNDTEVKEVTEIGISQLYHHITHRVCSA